MGLETEQLQGERVSDELRFENKLEIVRLSQKGLKISRLKHYLKECNFTMKEMAKLLHLSERQLSRYSAEFILPVDITARIYQIVEVWSRGLEVFEDRDMLNRWLRKPIMALGFGVPIALMETPQGVEVILDELGRIEHGLVA